MMTITRNTFRRGQGGIALVSVMGAIAVITVIVSTLSYRQHIDIGIQGYAIQKGGVILNVLSVENIATGMLTQGGSSASNNPAYDYYDENWAEAVVDHKIGGTQASFIILDAQAKFNVNNLNIAGNNRRHMIEVLRNVFATLDLNDGKIYQEVANWLRPGNTRVEDRLYFQDSVGFDKYRASDSPMISINELRLMVSFREEEDIIAILDGFEDYVEFLPTLGELVKLNVNTASEVILTEALKYFGASNSLPTIMANRPFSNINSFCNFLRKRKNICNTIFDVKSSYFYVYARMDMGDNQAFSKSLLRVQGNDATVITREIKVI